jgi:hypothetical protein
MSARILFPQDEYISLGIHSHQILKEKILEATYIWKSGRISFFKIIVSFHI